MAKTKIKVQEEPILFSDAQICETADITMAQLQAVKQATTMQIETAQQEIVAKMRKSLSMLLDALESKIGRMDGNDLTNGIMRIADKLQLLSGEATFRSESVSKVQKIDLSVDDVTKWIQSLPEAK